MNTDLELIAGGVSYTGWTQVSVSRGMDACASAFSLTCPERFASAASPVPLRPFTPVVLRHAGQTLLTGFIFGYRASFGVGKHEAIITGRSATAQLVDCTPDIPAGQYQGYTLAAIARAVCQIFGLTAKLQTTLANTALADSTLERGETAFRFIDRLATICGVLAYDDETGALVLGNAGADRAAGALVEGVPGGIIEATVTDDCAERFSIYIVKGQSGICAAAGASGFPSGAGDAAPGSDATPSLITPSSGEVLTQQRAVAVDPGVPIYRPKIIMAEGQLTQAQMQLRANWQRSYHYGHSLTAEITVPGWVQPDGTLWRINQMVPVRAPGMGMDEDLLILKLEWTYSLDGGHHTKITVGPVDGAIPSPALLKTRRKKGRKGRVAYDWNGVDE
ncbi:phage baseplate assembly protein [Acidocella sp.]|uniref:phage baseplate assembly protein n=1 Tax=Acidocella sp. TaxID=50710 RepID=UPI0026399382|nr:hypothetical protein [Acidocella sp.]MDD2794358.1 hypothetical protein [Acidocella sp.]